MADMRWLKRAADDKGEVFIHIHVPLSLAVDPQERPVEKHIRCMLRNTQRSMHRKERTRTCTTLSTSRVVTVYMYMYNAIYYASVV